MNENHRNPERPAQSDKSKKHSENRTIKKPIPEKGKRTPPDKKDK